MGRFQITGRPGAFRVYKRGGGDWRATSFELVGATHLNTRVVMKGDRLKRIYTDATVTFQPAA